MEKLTYRPGAVLGRRRDGRAILPIAGGSTPAPPPEGQQGTTVAGVTIPYTPPPAPAPAQQIQTFDPEQYRAQIEAQLRQEFEARQADLQTQFQQQLQPFEEERAQRQREAEEAQRQAEEAERQRREAEESAAERMARYQQETDARIAAMQEDLARRDAIIAQEQRRNELAEYTRRKVEEAGETLMPHLRPNVYGNSEAEIDASLSRQVEISNAIMSDTQAALGQQAAFQQQAFQAQPGVTPTAPSIGPLEGNGVGQVQNLTADQLRNMEPDEYARNREQLLAATSQLYRTGQ